MILDLSKQKLLIKTTYAGRRTDTPLISITKKGTLSVNAAFMRKFFSNIKDPSTLYVQLVSFKDEYFILISKKKRAGFYSLFVVKAGTGTVRALGFKEILGKKGVTMRYAVEKVKTTDPSLHAFKLSNVAADFFSSTEKSSFETVG
jgi:hypothetical protein